MIDDDDDDNDGGVNVESDDEDDDKNDEINEEDADFFVLFLQPAQSVGGLGRFCRVPAAGFPPSLS